ncbi:MAG: glycosyltransferase [Verrucomicrobiota bacterium]
MNVISGALAVLSLVLILWQWLAARRFPLHQRLPADPRPPSPVTFPSLTLLKPLKGCDAFTEACLRSWFSQQYQGPIQILFAVASPDDPVCGIVRKLQQEFPAADSRLVICGPLLGANAKVSQLVQLEPLIKHDRLVISDADVLAPPDFLAAKHPASRIPPGLTCCFYCLANPATLAMQWEAVAINADFWSQVLQSQTLKPIDFALGAVMATPRRCLEEIGGFKALADCLADDYQLGHRIARRGYGIELSPVVVECWSEPMGWSAVWKHQLRWARTVRVCQPAPYFFSILSNGTLWPLVWLAANPALPVVAFAGFAVLVRILTALGLQRRLSQSSGGRWVYAWLVPVKDILQAAIWILAFLGNSIEWRGRRMRLRRDGTLEPQPGPGRG